MAQVREGATIIHTQHTVKIPKGTELYDIIENEGINNIVSFLDKIPERPWSVEDIFERTTDRHHELTLGFRGGLETPRDIEKLLNHINKASK